MPLNPPLGRKLRMGLVGGGRGSFIGRVHVTAAQLDGRAVLVAGALSSDAENARASAVDYGIAPERAYGSYTEMIERERALPAGERIDFVSIATPNHTHFEIAHAFVAAGFNAFCDKPMTLDLPQARELAEAVQEAGVVFAVTHNYTGYPLVRQARAMTRGGQLGEVQAVRVCYLQGSLRRQRTPEQQRRFAWKTDPARAGISGCFGDIGIHAYNLLRYITGLLSRQVSCHLCIFEPGGQLDDYGTARFRFQGGALGTLTASRISHGRENGLWIEIDGTKASLSWHQEEPNQLWLRANGQPHRLYTRDPNADSIATAAQLSCRLPAGHPEGFFEAFANVYTAAFTDISARAGGHPRDASKGLYPTALDGVEGLEFVTQCVESSRNDAAWMPMGNELLTSFVPDE